MLKRWSSPLDLEAVELPALRSVPATRRVARLAEYLLVAFALAVIGLVFVPWQQNIRGSGRVVALDPLDRAQILEAPITGRIVSWHVTEGRKVAEGDLIAEIRDLDPLRLDRLRTQEENMRTKVAAAERKLEFMEMVVDDVRSARESKIESARQKVSMTKEKLQAERQNLIAAEASEDQKQKKFERTRQLVEDEIASTQDLEIDERELAEASAKRRSAEAYVRSAEADQGSAEAYLEATDREEQSKVNKALGELEQVRGEVALNVKDLQDLLGKIATQETQAVRAPRDGVIQRLIANQGQEIVKTGDDLAVLVPDTESRIVEAYVDGVNAPLIRQGRPVRLQFEGFPALQFAGWPAVQVGTFGGKVLLVDPNASDDGKFRVLIKPDQGGDEEDWPDPEDLRQGARAKAWVLLDRVSLGYEIWRQLNGFPPTVQKQEKVEKIKVPK